MVQVTEKNITKKVVENTKVILENISLNNINDIFNLKIKTPNLSNLLLDIYALEISKKYKVSELKNIQKEIIEYLEILDYKTTLENKEIEKLNISKFDDTLQNELDSKNLLIKNTKEIIKDNKMILAQSIKDTFNLLKSDIEKEKASLALQFENAGVKDFKITKAFLYQRLLNSIESKTGSYATTSSNTFVDTQYACGCLCIARPLTTHPNPT